ncbi:hypothetical protein GO495_08205 [Chitinophaga oryziterrae]|uniref:Uncharacterized protein n=1 Tax=Chitinophaga oryziterrae TaxID=1031224 RepID=A0A6N8J8X6_9BACT|nr:hypothetical protein [Chitinophaga oryziterrae]MVT40562.1 hypothetical protein [Chitinophaga oryziterrae]
MDKDFLLPIRTRLIRNGDLIAQELQSTINTHRRWIAISKRSENSKHMPFEWLYKMYDFEFDKIVIETRDEYTDKNIINERIYYFKDEEELRNALSERGMDLSKFTYPWKCDYPL